MNIRSFLKFFLLLFLVSCSTNYKQIQFQKTGSQIMTPGYDVLGVAKYCKRFLNAPALPGMSTLMNTFGDPLPCVEKRIQKGGLQLVEIDLIDATCWRNHVCPSGAPKPDDLKEIKKRAAKVEMLAEKYPNVEFWVSPALEHDVKNSATVTKMLNAAKEGCPRCKAINSPFTGATPAGFEIEKHGTTVSAYSVSSDGQSIFDGDNLSSDGNNFQHRIAGRRATFAWWNELNLRCTGEKTFTQPKKRTEKPTADQFRQAYMTMQPEPPIPPAPPQCKIVRLIKSPEIGKPNAESYCNGQKKDNRGNRGLLIIKKSGSAGKKLKLFNSAGKQVGCYAWYGTYPSIKNAHRWYEGSCSGKYPAELSDAMGGEWGYVELSKGSCLLVNVIRRTGSYR